MGTILDYGEPLLNGPSPQSIVLVRQVGPGRPPAQRVPGRPSEVKKQKERAKKLVAGAPGIGIPLVGAHTGSPPSSVTLVGWVGASLGDPSGEGGWVGGSGRISPTRGTTKVGLKKSAKNRGQYFPPVFGRPQRGRGGDSPPLGTARGAAARRSGRGRRRRRSRSAGR